MKVKMLKFWRGYQQGIVYDVGLGVADALVNVARAGVFVDALPVETASACAPETSCMQSDRRRGRPVGSKNKVKIPTRFEGE